MLGWLIVAVAVIVVVIVYKWLNSQQVDVTSESRYVLITGCDRGFGHLAAKRLDALGCHVIAGCLTERGEDELKKSCSNRLITLHLDVTNHDTITRAFDTVVNHLPPNKGQFCIQSLRNMWVLNYTCNLLVYIQREHREI
jgi:retinol dehydrogenase-16